MDTNALFVSLVFGAIGMGMFMYGKKSGRMIPLGTGLALMVFPYFIPNVIALFIVCSVLTTVPWFMRGA